MTRLFPDDRVQLAAELCRDGERLPMGTMGTVVSLDANGERAEVEWDVPSKVVLLLDVDSFWVQLCSGYGPPPETLGVSEPSNGTADEGII
ncbi:MAG: hypothetical protein QOE52_3719 [Mycobacterium sp.]|jgi:hypothetical protein|uniref:hypothetical protein n=1 Tax=Mycobacterium sp. TaxID=1785 RepID=UPI0028B75347|nr:hypothetical protein [Mycobacterium sp.]MDT5344535.1 hypothetical protein [Mycobacterium sp.]